MKLEHRRIYIKDIKLGNETKVEEGILTVNEKGLIDHLKQDKKIKVKEMVFLE